MNRATGFAGQSDRTSCQVSAVENSTASSSMVMSVAKVLPGDTVTASASVPNRISIGSRPIARQDSTSPSLMGRDALEMSDSPSTQKRSKPAPEPMLSMVIWPEYPSFSNRAAIASASGNTVDEPAAAISPVTSRGSTIGSTPVSTGGVVGLVVPPVVSPVVVSCVESPQAATTMATAASSATNPLIFLDIPSSLFGVPTREKAAPAAPSASALGENGRKCS